MGGFNSKKKESIKTRIETIPYAVFSDMIFPSCKKKESIKTRIETFGAAGFVGCWVFVCKKKESIKTRIETANVIYKRFRNCDL